MSDLSKADILWLLQDGTLEAEGLLPWSSNYTFLVTLCHDQNGGVEVSAVYKPQRGERPLWDFAPGSLCRRERAAFLVSDALGWDLVPPTVLRHGPHGLGSVQYFVDHDPERHYFTIEGEPAYAPQLQKIALFDILINNADRKSGHVLLDNSATVAGPARLWGIDHGICFHMDYKLRTVIWEFVGQPIPPDSLAELHRFQSELEHPASLATQLGELLAPPELRALRQRLQDLLSRRAFPGPGPGRHYPWPPV